MRSNLTMFAEDFDLISFFLFLFGKVNWRMTVTFSFTHENWMHVWNVSCWFQSKSLQCNSISEKKRKFTYEFRRIPFGNGSHPIDGWRMMDDSIKLTIIIKWLTAASHKVNFRIYHASANLFLRMFMFISFLEPSWNRHRVFCSQLFMVSSNNLAHTRTWSVEMPMSKTNC